MMKKFFCIFFLTLAALVSASGQSHLSERVYVSTDKDVYVSGDDMFFSAFCLDASKDVLSGASAIAYMEICSPDGPVQTAKVALSKGRGSGYITIKNTIPTGNYRLVAYTAQCFNEEGYDFESGSKVISIINPFTTDRSQSGVEILSDDEYASLSQPAPAQSGSVSASVSGQALTVTNNSDKPLTLSVSISHNDGIVPPSDSSPVSFRKSMKAGTSFAPVRELEFEGEVIRAKVIPRDEEDLPKFAGVEALLSVPGEGTDLYTSTIGEDGSAVFYTRNIYGDVEAITEVLYEDLESHLDLESPFKGVNAGGLEPLKLSRSLEDEILQRSTSMQIQKAMSADSLYERLPVPEDLLFGDDALEYILDDYTRFPLMEELFIEFISPARVRRTDNGRAIYLVLQDTFKPGAYEQILPVMTLLDGVPVTDHESILNYDPLLVEKIIVYPHTYCFGHWSFGGVINFITYKRNLPSYEFGHNTRAVDFQGASIPVASYLPVGSADVPDMRETILWHPQLEIGPGERRVLNFALPSYDGEFDVVVEGFDSEGAPQYYKTALQ